MHQGSCALRAPARFTGVLSLESCLPGLVGLRAAEQTVPVCTLVYTAAVIDQQAIRITVAVYLFILAFLAVAVCAVASSTCLGSITAQGGTGDPCTLQGKTDAVLLITFISTRRLPAVLWAGDLAAAQGNKVGLLDRRLPTLAAMFLFAATAQRVWQTMAGSAGSDAAGPRSGRPPAPRNPGRLRRRPADDSVRAPYKPRSRYPCEAAGM